MAAALALEAAGRVPANRRKKELGDLAHAGVRFPRMRGPRAPVAVGTLPGRFVTWRYPSNAKATASFASPSKKTSSKWRTRYRSRGFYDRGEQRRVLRAAARYEHFADRLGDEAPVGIGDAPRRQLHRRRDDVLVARSGRASAARSASVT